MRSSGPFSLTRHPPTQASAIPACFGLSGALVFLSLFAFAGELFRGFNWSRERWEQLAPTGYLLIWTFLTTAFYLVLSPFIPARHILLILPAVTLLLLLFWHANLSVPAQRFGLALTILVSLGLVISDWRLAAFLRQETVTLPASLPANARLWTDAPLGAGSGIWHPAGLRSSTPRPRTSFLETWS